MLQKNHFISLHICVLRHVILSDVGPVRPKHGACIGDIIKSLICVTVIYMLIAIYHSKTGQFPLKSLKSKMLHCSFTLILTDYVPSHSVLIH